MENCTTIFISLKCFIKIGWNGLTGYVMYTTNNVAYILQVRWYVLGGTITYHAQPWFEIKKNANHSPVSSIDPNETCSVFRQIINSTRGVFHAIHSDMLHLVAAGAGKCDLTGKKLQEIMTHKSN